MTFAGPTAAAVIQLLHTQQQHHVSLVILSRAHAHADRGFGFSPLLFPLANKRIDVRSLIICFVPSSPPAPLSGRFVERRNSLIRATIYCRNVSNEWTCLHLPQVLLLLLSRVKKIWEQTGWSRQQQPSGGTLKNLLPHWRNFSTLLWRRDGVSDHSSLDTHDIDEERETGLTTQSRTSLDQRLPSTQGYIDLTAFFLV